MKAQKKQPELRFKGFTDDWEQVELNSFSDVRDGTHSSPKYIENGYPMVTSKNLSEFGLDMTDISYISADNFNEIKKRSKVDIGDILFGMIGTIGNPIIVNRDDFAIKNVALIKEKKQTKILNTWLLQYFKTPTFNRFIQQETAGGTQKFIALGLIRSMRVLIPSVTEQKEIGEFFQKLDQAITLQQRKHELLKKLKQGYLQQMFPAKKQVIPLLRFNEFNETWKLEKLGDITKSFSGGTPTAGTKKYYNGKIPFIRSAEINKRKTELFLTEKGVANSSAKLVSKGTILYALYGATSGEVGVSQIDGAINQAILAIIPNDEYSTLFIVQWLRNNKKKITDKYLQGGQGNLSGTIIKDLQIKFPSSKEQKLVGEFFMKLDQNITLQQLKIKQLQRLKQAYLQKIFP